MLRPSQGLDTNDQPLLHFQFCVRYYVQTPLILQDPLSRHHYYLQLRDNLLTYGQVRREDQAYQLAALALQADFGDTGDRDQTYRGPPYFDPLHYCPQWVVEREGLSQVIAKVSVLHQEHHNMSKEEAQLAFIDAASSDEAPHNVHLYNLRRKKGDPTSQVTLAVGDKGISIYEEEPGPNFPIRRLSCTYPWLTIDLVTFDIGNREGLKDPAVGQEGLVGPCSVAGRDGKLGSGGMQMTGREPQAQHHQSIAPASLLPASLPRRPTWFGRRLDPAAVVLCHS
ncbi:FERM central domain [Trinorchestia longiramus]|nr:FERM central domain [Trinorchestia longiramus]